jgi:hypothetical protein
MPENDLRCKPEVASNVTASLQRQFMVKAAVVAADTSQHICHRDEASVFNKTMHDSGSSRFFLSALFIKFVAELV